MKMYKKISTFIIVLVLSNYLFSMEKEAKASKKIKVEAASQTSKPEISSASAFLPKFDSNQSVIIIENSTYFDFRLWIRNNYFESNKEYFIVDRVYTQNFDQYLATDVGHGIVLPRNSY